MVRIRVGRDFVGEEKDGEGIQREILLIAILRLYAVRCDVVS